MFYLYPVKSRSFLKDDYCFINGQCIASGKTDTEENCLACRPSENKFNWTTGNI